MTDGNFVTGVNTDSVALIAGETVRISTTARSVVRAQANSPAGVVGLLGVVISGVANPGGVANVCITGPAPVLLDTGLAPAAGDALYVSAVTAGRATTVPTGPMIGTAFDASDYVTDHSVVGVIGTEGAGGATGDAGFQRDRIADMAAISTGAFADNTTHVCRVLSVGDSYTFVTESALTADGIIVVDAKDGGGQWLRMGIQNPTFLQQTFWCVDSVGGSNEARGWGVDQADAEAHALKTMAELNRRQVGQLFNSTTSMLRIGIANDIPLSDNLPLTNIKSSGFFFYPNLVGKRVQVDGDFTISAYATENPAANTGFLVTAPGLSSSHVDLLMQSADGTKSAVVQASSGANQLRVSQPNTSDVETGALGTTTNFVLGETVRMFRLPRVPRIPWTGDSGGFGMAWVRHGYGYAAQGDISYIGGISLFAVQSASEGDQIIGGTDCSWTCESFRPGADTSPTLLYDHTAFGFADAIHGNGLFLLKNTDFEPACIDIQAGSLDIESSRLVLGGGFNLSVFNCAGDAITVRVFAEVSMQGNGHVYGSGNHGAIVNFQQKTAGVLYPIAGLIAVTSVAAPLVVNGVGVQYAALPYADPVTLTGVSVWA